MADAHLQTGSILRISDEKTMQLLDLYRKEECLWNTHNDFYKDQLHRRRASERIAAVLAIPNFGPRHVIMKFKNLRNAYSQELKKIERNKVKCVKYKPSVFWYKKMDAFIRPHLQKPRGSGAAAPSSNLIFHVDGNEEWLQSNPQTSPKMDEQTSENESSDSQRKRKTKLKSTPTRPKFQKLDSDSDESRFIEISIPQHPEIETTNINSSRLDQSIQDYIDDQQKNVLRSLQDLSSNLRALSSRGDDVFDSFGKYVAGLLRTLPHNKALEVQPQIVDLITAAGLANIASQEKEVRPEVRQEERYEVRQGITPEEQQDVKEDIDVCESVVVKIESI